jgi:hydroxymethylbilane synthase
MRLGTRGSRLALIQSELVAARLRERGVDVELVTVVTKGDVRPPDAQIGEGIFVTALERALVAGEIDLAVHSAKDLPLDQEPSLVIAAYPERADPRDALVTRGGESSLEALPPRAKVGTDSPRRTGFVHAIRPDLEVIPLHGNVDTRLRRLDSAEADAIVIACAGLDRLGAGGRIAARLDPALMPPAPGQGALAVQARRDDDEVLAALKPIDDPEVRLAVIAERAVLRAMGGGCRAPVGAVARSLDGGSLSLLAGAVATDGSRKHVLMGIFDDVMDGSLWQSALEVAGILMREVGLETRAILDTRPEVDPMAVDGFLRLGFRLLHVPTIAIEAAGPQAELEHARSRLRSYDWVVVTSKRGVEALLQGDEVEAPPSLRWAAVGARTAAALREHGVQADVVPDEADSGSIPRAMAARGSLRGARVLLARADIAGGALPEQLRREGAVVDDVVAYTTVTGPERSRPAILDALNTGELEAVVFASGSAVRGLVHLAGDEVARARALKVFTIGPKTSAVARELGFEVTAEATWPGVEGLLEAVREGFDKEVERWVASQLPPAG